MPVLNVRVDPEPRAAIMASLGYYTRLHYIRKLPLTGQSYENKTHYAAFAAVSTCEYDTTIVRARAVSNSLRLLFSKRLVLLLQFYRSVRRSLHRPIEN